MYNPSAPIVHVKIAFKNSGASYQEKSKIGVPSFYSSSVFCGCEKYSKMQFEKEVANISSSISCANDTDVVAFSMTAPSIVLDKAVHLLNCAIRDPKFEKDKVKMVQDGIIATMQDYALHPADIAAHVFIPSIIFKSHVYENGMYGSPEDFARLSIDDLKKYKDKFVVTSNAEACVFGDVSEAQAIAVIDKIFSGVGAGTPVQDSVTDAEPQISNVVKKYYANGPQSTIVFALKGVRVRSQSRYAAFVLLRIFGGSGLFKSKIMNELRTKLGLIYGGYVSMADFNHASNMLGILKTDNSKVEQAITALRSIIKNLRENGITESDLEFAKSNIIGSTLVELRTSAKMCDFHFLAMLRGYGTNALQEIINGVRNVTLDDVKKLAGEILDENNISIVIIGGNSE
jgi:zinc protease